MKKWIALTLTLTMALSLCACANNGGETEKKDEKVTVSMLTKAVVTNTYDDESEKMDSVLEYDKDYNLIGAKTHQDGKLVSEITYDKDPYRPLVEQDYDEDGNKDDRQEYTYDKDGNQLTHIKYDKDGQVDWKYVYTYDKDGKLLTTQSYTGDELDYTTTCTYDEHGNLLTERNENGGEDWENTYENIYENDKLMEVKAYQDGALFLYTKYDSDGNEVLSVTYEDEDEYSRTENTYEDGKLIKQIGYTLGEESYRCEFTYNESDKLVQQLGSYGDGYEFKTVYTYNDNGDLITASRYTDGDLVSEITMTYETVTVSKEQAKKIEKVANMLGMG